MTRYAVGVALGLLLAPSLAHAQQSSYATIDDGVVTRTYVTRAFKSVTFAQTPAVVQKFPSAPRKADAPPDCRMLILPVDPALDAKIRVGTVDETLDPRFVMRVPACQPSNQSNQTPPPRD
jgi:hypothetical protein